MNEEISYIRNVEISNLWGRKRLSWDLNPDVNILSGINGSGKSTILDLIFGLISLGTTHYPYLGLVDRIKITFNNNKSISYEHLEIKDSIKNIKKHAIKGDELYIDLLKKIMEDKGKDINKIKAIEAHTHKTSFDFLDLQDIHNAINIDAISTFDVPLKQSEAVTKLSDDTVKTELDWEIYQLQKKYLDYQLSISKRKDSIIESKLDKHQLDKLNWPKKRFLEIINQAFSETEKQINAKKNEISFLLEGTKELSPFQLSSGEKQLLIILLTVLVQDNKPSILFLDEPEISLHIEWQKKIIQYIRELNPSAQLILATHSPGIVMEGWQDKIFELSDILI